MCAPSVHYLQHTSVDVLLLWLGLQEGLVAGSSLTCPPGHSLVFATFHDALRCVVAVVNSSRGDAHILIFDETLSYPPLMDDVALPVS